MKIAFLNFYSGIFERGLETFIDEVASRLAKDHDVTLYQAGAEKGTHQYRVLQTKVEFDTSRVYQKYSFLWRLYLDYSSLKKKEFTQKVLRELPVDTDIIVATNGGWQGLLVRQWTWKYHKKMVIPGQSGKGWDDRINLLCRPDTFVALTYWQKNWAQRNGFGVRVETIPNGVDLNKFNIDVKPAKINLPRPLVLCVAALEKDKRIDLIINAVAKADETSLLIIGKDGPEGDNLKKLAKRLLPNRCHFLSVPHDEIASYYKAADLFTFAPVRSESFGIVYLEAMACGLPIVAPDDPIRHEIVGPAGLYVDPTDTDKYAQTILTALKQNWTTLPLEQAKKYSWERISRQYEELFKTLL